MKKSNVITLKPISDEDLEEMKPDIDRILEVYFNYGITPCINGLDPKIIEYIEKKTKDRRKLKNDN